MAHQPYRDWLAAEEPSLTPADLTRLSEHLTLCSECRAFQVGLAQLDQILSNPPMAPAPPGFLARFQGRLASRESRPRLLLGGAALGFGALGAMLTLGILLAPLAGELATAASRPELAQGMLSGAGSLARTVVTVGGALLTGVRILLATLSGQPLVAVYALGGLCLALFWVEMLRKYAPQGSTVR